MNLNEIRQTALNEIKKVADPLIARLELVKFQHALYEAYFASIEKRNR